MSNIVNNKANNKINIGKELLMKLILDSIGVFFAFCIVFYLIKFSDFTPAEISYFLFFGCPILIGLLWLTGMGVKKPLNKLIDSTIKNTSENIGAFLDKNNSQKENNSFCASKIDKIQALVDNLQKFSTTMNELTNETQEKTDRSLNFTNNEYNAVKSNIEKMFSIRHKIQTIAELILELSDFVQSISSTIGLVEDIAEQTNLLALNAAVEAARAGEHGKGFAVVASEIRKLADESKQATTKIISLINDIQQTANSTVLATEEGTKEIESGLELAHVISENIEQLINVMSEISNNMQNIIVSSQQIDTNSKETNTYIKEISKIVEESQKITSENDSIFEKIESNSNDLKQSIF